MNGTWIRHWSVGIAWALAAHAGCGATLPVSLEYLTGRWNPAHVGKEVAPGITFELVATHVGAPDRLIFLSSPMPDQEPGDLGTFAHRLVASFTAFRSVNLEESRANRMGFAGIDLSFELVNDSADLACNLFAFSDQGTWWGVLYTKPKDATTSAAEAFALLRKYVPPASGVVTMDPYSVKDDPISDFPISIEITRNHTGDRVSAIAVSKVPENSVTQRAGVKVGDIVVAIDGRKVEGFAAGVGKDSELGRIFLNRQPGDKVTLEIQHPGDATSFIVTLPVRERLESRFDLFHVIR